MNRVSYLEKIADNLKLFKVVALLGSRQVGKTTIAREYCKRLGDFPWRTHYFDLEDPTALLRLEDPKLALSELEGLVVIDEVQRRPELFSVLRYLLDRPDNKLQLLILGSASRELIKQSSESLAGRISYLEVHPFGLDEITTLSTTSPDDNLWLRGGYPLAYLADNNEQAFRWLGSSVKTYLEQDIPNLGISIPAETLRRFWMMLVHTHGNILNTAELARSFGIADTTARRYLDILSGTFMIRQLQPYFANIKKRQIKSPKIYFRDTGLLHQMIGISDMAGLRTHLKCGASWEGFALEQIVRAINASNDQCYFWGVHAQGELDLLIQHKGNLEAFEFKFTSTPNVTNSMQLALKTLPITQITVVAPVETSFPIHERITVSPLTELIKSLNQRV